MQHTKNLNPNRFELAYKIQLAESVYLHLKYLQFCIALNILTVLTALILLVANTISYIIYNTCTTYNSYAMIVS